MGNTVRCFAMKLFCPGEWRWLARGLLEACSVARVATAKVTLDLIYRMKAEPTSYVELTFYQKSIG
jgi:hypothetical protein